jgi:hypothetical protein
MSFGTLKTVHDQLASVGSSTSFSSLTSFEDSSDKAFKDIPSISSGTSFSTLTVTTYQVIEIVPISGTIVQIAPRSSQSAIGSIADPGTFPQDKLLSMEFVFESAPYIGQTKSGINVYNFDWIFNGQPFVVTQSNGPSLGSIIGTIDQVARPAIQDLSGSVIVSGSIAQTAPSPTQSAVDFVLVTGTIDQTAPRPVQSMSGSVSIIGSIDQTAPRAIQQLSESPNLEIIDYSGIKILIGDLEEDSSGIKIEIADLGDNDALAGIEIIVADFDLASVTSLASTQFEPTVIIDGETIVSNVSTDPGTTDTSRTPLYIHWLSTGIDGNEWTDLSQFGLELDYYGGHFGFTSKKPLKVVDTGLNPLNLTGNYFNYNGGGAQIISTPLDPVVRSQLGKQLEVFGFNGSVVDFGATISDSAAGWITQGIFGTPKLHKALNLIFFGTQLGRYLSSNERFNANGRNVPIGDAQSVAQSIASVCGISLTWAIANAPLQNTFRIDGLTGIEAIASLAALSGGTIRWNGNNKYIVAYPDQAFGVWEVPHPNLITPAGITWMNHEDLETGVAGTGMVIIPKAATFDSSTRSLINTKPSGSLPVIQRIPVTRQRLNSDDAPIVLDLPSNWERLFVQILVADAGFTGGVNSISPLNNFITRKPEEFFELDLSGILAGTGTDSSTAYIFNTFYGDTYVPQFKIDHKFFPLEGVNTSIDDGKFVMTVAVATRSLADLYNRSKENINNLVNQNLSSFNAYRFIKTYTGTITCQFYGTIPLPGMWGKAVIPDGAIVRTLDLNGNIIEDRIPLDGDMVVEGIIENVQLSYPGIITVQVAQYARVDYLQLKSNISTSSIGKE